MMETRRAILLVSLLVLAAAAACSSSGGPPVSPSDLPDVDGTTGDLAPDAPDGPSDTGGRDGLGDVTPLTPCATDADCAPREHCLQSYAGRACLPECLQQDSCPAGYFCRAMGVEAGTLLFVCLPDLPQVCLPCAKDADCNDGACVTLDGEPRCATFCTAEDACPDGYACRDAGTVDAARPDLGLCRPASGSCECSARTAGQQRPCFREGTDGTCRGFEACDPVAGWTGCDAPEPAVEDCDGVDNDCDGTLDEGLAAEIDCERSLDGVGTCTGRATCAGRNGWNCNAPVPAPEACDHLDNDCDGEADEDFRVGEAYGTDDHCGNCGIACAGTIAHGTAFCDASLSTPFCAVKSCDPGYYAVGKVLCVPADVPHCLPCSSDAQCAGGTCLDMAGSGFCTSPCSDASQCGDLSCVEKRDPAGALLGSFCLPMNGSCDCTPEKEGQEEACSFTNAAGTCFGSHTCDPDLGWVGCTATLPAAETCDGLDNDCDGVPDDDLPEVMECTRDAPGIGTCTGVAVCRGGAGWDCDAGTPAAEACDGLDNDCDGLADEEGATGCGTFHPDADGDGFGAPTGAACLCAADAGHPVRNPGDCDDERASAYPGALESCNGLDDDCDGDADEEGAAGCTPHYLDGDGDGYGVAGPGRCLCGPEAPYVAPGLGDCDDTNPALGPGAVEACNGRDDDCDDDIDEDGASGCTTWHRDLDGDGWGADDTARCLCEPAEHYTLASGGDCDDQIAAIHPGVAESCNLFDDDCDGLVDEEATNCQTFWRDADGDGFGVAGDTQCRCLPEAPYEAVVAGDCDDGQAAVRPVAIEVCNGVDDNCDGVTDGAPDLPGCTTFFADGDGDGYGRDDRQACACTAPPGFPATSGGDCDDAAAAVNPGVADPCNGRDDDCDGATDEGAPDLDGDGLADCVDPCPVLVDGAAGPGGDGSVAAPFRTIQQGIDGAGQCAEVWVRPGTYGERLVFGGQDVMVRSVDGPEATVLDAGGLGSAVTFAAGESPAAGMDGFTIRGGSGTPGAAPWGDPALTYGGGILVRGAAPTVTGCVLADNHVTGQGGGLFLHASAGRFDGGSIRGNTSTRAGDGGAGVAMVESSASVHGADIRDNVATGAGGGVLLQSSGGSLRYNRIVRNTAAEGAGIRLADRVTAIVDGNVVADNVGDGVSFQHYSSTRFIDNTVVGNTGHGLRVTLCCGETFSVPLIKNCIVARNGANGIRTDYNVDFGLFFTDTFGNTGGNYGGVMGSLSNTSLGITSRDCRFAAWTGDGDPDNDDLRLQAGSPCIDSGGDVTLYFVTRDLAGEPRPVNGTGGAFAQYDRGAYEHQQ